MKYKRSIAIACHLNTSILLALISSVYAIWPPPYSVNLKHEETFVISEPLDQNDVQDVYDEEELIKQEDLAERQNDRYFRIHQQVRRYDKYSKDDTYNSNETKLFKEFNPDIEEAVPWKAGFVDDQGKFKPDKGVIYFDQEPPTSFGENKPKRSDEQNKNASVNYDYNNFKAEYESNIKSAQNANDTVKYSTVKEEESVKESIKEMVNFKEAPKNCTAEEVNGIGLAALECFWLESKKPRMKSRVLEKAIRIVIIWFILYIIIAIPCWCQYGWCCCCCRCKFCRPKENIDEVKTFFANNPIGTYHDEKGKTHTYKPTHYEKYAYMNLERELNKL